MVKAEEVARDVEKVAREVATLDERLTNVREDVKAVKAKSEKADDTAHEIRTKLAVIEERLNELKKVLEETSRKWWAIVPSLVGAVLGGALTVLGHLLLRKLFP